jgi:hypothetical protein
MSTYFARLASLCIVGLALIAPLLEQPTPSATTSYDSYIHALETRLGQQHRASSAFLAPLSVPQADTRLRNGEFLVENLTPTSGPELPGALLFHWRGTNFVAGANAADFERLLRDFNAYPKTFSPQVLQAAVLSQDGDHLLFRMRVRQHHVLTVVLDTTYEVTFRRLDHHTGYSLSRSTQISEIESAGTPSEKTLSPFQAHGFMWRLNTYWTWEERDGGLYLQIESVSLTRSIPPGLGWMVRPFVESIPRESLEFTLRSAARALRKEPVAPDASYTTDPKAGNR